MVVVVVVAAVAEEEVVAVAEDLVAHITSLDRPNTERPYATNTHLSAFLTTTTCGPYSAPLHQRAEQARVEHSVRSNRKCSS